MSVDIGRLGYARGKANYRGNRLRIARKTFAIPGGRYRASSFRRVLCRRVSPRPPVDGAQLGPGACLRKNLQIAFRACAFSATSIPPTVIAVGLSITSKEVS